jgi:predicted RNase H-like nuclease
LGYRTDFHLQEPRQASDEIGDPLRRLIEVYPHPATLALFDLDHIIRYKKGSAVDRGRELRRFQRLLGKTLSRMNPPVRIGEMACRIFAEDPGTLRGVARKRHEDTLDAIVCALVGWIHWWHGGQRSEVLGDLQSGFIVVPLADGAVMDAWTTS